MSPTRRRHVQRASGAVTEPPNLSEMAGESHITANTPRRAMAISSPIARAISLPLNHLAMAFDTVVPAISQPHPNIMKPRAAIFALPGIAVHQLFSQLQSSVVWNQSLIPMYFITAPVTMSDAESTPVKRMPILSRMIPAIIRKPHTFRIYSDAAYVPNTPLSQPLSLSIRDFRGDITSTNMYAKNIIRAMSISAAHLAAA